MENVFDKYIAARDQLWGFVNDLSLLLSLEELKPIQRGIWFLPAERRAEYNDLHAQMVACYRQCTSNIRSAKTQRWPVLVEGVSQITLSVSEAKSSESYLANGKKAKQDVIVLADSKKMPPGQSIAAMTKALKKLKLQCSTEKRGASEKLRITPDTILKAFPDAKKLVVHRNSGKAYTARLNYKNDTERINVDILVVDNPKIKIFQSPPRRPRPRMGDQEGVVEIKMPGEGWVVKLFAVMK